jgi:hypothetical protein
MLPRQGSTGVTPVNPPSVVSQENLNKISGVYVAAGFSLRSFFLIISQAKACGYILNAHG